MGAELVVRVGRDMVKLIHREQPVIKGRHAEPVHGKAEGGMGADQHLVRAVQERLDGIHLAAVFFRAGCVAQVPLRGDNPVPAQNPYWLRGSL